MHSLRKTCLDYQKKFAVELVGSGCECQAARVQEQGGEMSCWDEETILGEETRAGLEQEMASQKQGCVQTNVLSLVRDKLRSVHCKYPSSYETDSHCNEPEA